MASIPNRMNTNSMKITAFINAFTEPTSELINFRIVGKALILLKGLSTLNVLKARTLKKET